MFSAALYAHVRVSLCTIAHEIAGAARIRHSLLPCFWEKRHQPLGRMASRECEVICRTVGWAKQSVPTIPGSGLNGAHGASAPLPTLRNYIHVVPAKAGTHNP